MICKRFFHVGRALAKNSGSSLHWLKRQESDPYVELAHKHNYRARSAFKLLHIDEKCKIFKPGHVVIELGAAPGAWTQVITSKVNAAGKDHNNRKGRVIALDRSSLLPVEGAVILSQCDFTDAASITRINELLGDHQADAVISDMSPNITGIRSLDSDATMNLVYKALKFALTSSKPGASFVTKVFMGSDSRKLLADMEKFYGQVKHVKPPASREESPELYMVGLKFKGLKKVP